MELDPLGPAVPAHRRGRNLTVGLEARHPAHRAGDAHAKTLGRRVARQPLVDHRLDNAFAKIVRKRHSRRLLHAAEMINQKLTNSRIPQPIQSVRIPL